MIKKIADAKYQRFLIYKSIIFVPLNIFLNYILVRYLGMELLGVWLTMIIDWVIREILLAYR